MSVCPACGADSVEGERYCEACGAGLPQTPASSTGPGQALGAPAVPGVGPAPDAAPTSGPVPEADAAPDAPVSPVPATSPSAPGAVAQVSSGSPVWQVPAGTGGSPVPPLPGAGPSGNAGPSGGGAGAPGETAVSRSLSPLLSATAPRCADCGGTVAADGYCEQCGAKVRLPRDGWEHFPVSWVAGATDLGRRHPRNEDAFAVAGREPAGSFAALLVCDGVSSAVDSDRASLGAVLAALTVFEPAVLAPAVSEPTVSGQAVSQPVVTEQVGTVGPLDDPHPDEAALVAAGAAAQAAVLACTPPDEFDNPPSCTFAAMVVRDGVLTAGWVGDSRCAWIPDAGRVRLLSRDDSWAAEQIALGVPREQAENGPKAHAITRWLGVDSPDPVPRCTRWPAEAPGWALVCSDGLWNYCSAPDALGDLVRRFADEVGGAPQALARALVDWANAQGGHDNISVALARVPAPSATARP